MGFREVRQIASIPKCGVREFRTFAAWFSAHCCFGTGQIVYLFMPLQLPRKWLASAYSFPA
jgi:hypothetical protein